MTLGEFIKQKRIESGMTQTNLYKHIPVARARSKVANGGCAFVSLIENDKRQLKHIQIEAIADVFGQTAGEFLIEFEAKCQ